MLPGFWNSGPARGPASESGRPLQAKRQRMQALVISDDGEISQRLRSILFSAGHLCQFPDILTLSEGLRRAASVRPGLAVVVISPDLSRGLAAIAELRQATPGRIVAVGPTDDPKLILECLHQGAEHYLDQSQPDVELKALLEQLVHLGAIRDAEPGRVYCLVTPSGGTGSSTLAVNLAVNLANQAGSSALLDLELETDDLSGLLDLKPSNTWVDLARHSDQLDQVGFERALTRHESGVSLLASPSDPADRGLVTNRVVHLAVTWARTLFPHVVIDLGLLVDEGKIEALRSADIVFVVFHLDFTSLRNARRQLQTLDAFGIERRRICLVANRTGQPNELTTTAAADCLGMPVATCVVDHPRVINQANNTGRPAVLSAPRSRFARDLEVLARLASRPVTT